MSLKWYLARENLFYKYYEAKSSDPHNLGTSFQCITNTWYKPIEKLLSKIGDLIYFYRRKKMSHAKCYGGKIGHLMWLLSKDNQIRWLRKISPIKKIK